MSLDEHDTGQDAAHDTEHSPEQETDTIPIAESERVTRELIVIAREGSEQDRILALERLTERYAPLVRSLAHRYAGRGVELDDLEQVAFLALLGAIHRFDVGRTTDFGAYVTPTVTGELRRWFRDRGWLVRPPRAVQERRQLVSDTRAELEQLLGHEPAVTELAEELELDEADVQEAQVASANLRPASLDATTPSGGQPVLELVEAQAPAQDDVDVVEHIDVRHAVGALPDDEQEVISLRFEHDLTQAQIAEVMGLTPMQVSRLLRDVLDRLRSDLEPGMPGGQDGPYDPEDPDDPFDPSDVGRADAS